MTKRVKKTKKNLSIIAKCRMKTKFAKPTKPKVGFVQVGQTKLRHGISKIEIAWLDRLCVPERSKVIRGFNNKVMIVDGYNPNTKTVFEMQGGHAHGSHITYPNNRDTKTWLGKTPNELYLGTVQRYQFLHDLGFKIFFVWDYEYRKGTTIGRYYRGKGDNLY